MIWKHPTVGKHKTYRDALATVLNGSPGFICTGAHSTIEQVIKALPSEKPHVLLLEEAIADASAGGSPMSSPIARLGHRDVPGTRPLAKEPCPVDGS